MKRKKKKLLPISKDVYPNNHLLAGKINEIIRHLDKRWDKVLIINKEDIPTEED